MFEKVVLVDGHGHLLGRLASTIAKELLNGQKIVVVRTEEINISGSLFRNKLKYASFIRKRTNTNPTRGPWHYRAPSRILWRVIRGMLPHKTERGRIALERLKVYEGIPHPFDRMKRVVIPGALRAIRLRPGRKYCRLGDLSAQVGWKHDTLITSLESKRKEKSNLYYKNKLIFNQLKAQALTNVTKDLSQIDAELVKLGYLLPQKQKIEVESAANIKKGKKKKAQEEAAATAGAEDEE